MIVSHFSTHESFNINRPLNYTDCFASSTKFVLPQKHPLRDLRKSLVGIDLVQRTRVVRYFFRDVAP